MRNEAAKNDWKKRGVMALFGVVALIAGPVSAAVMTGNELLLFLEEDVSSVPYGTAIGYINGVIDTSRIYQSDKRNPNLWCESKQTTRKQRADIVRKYLVDHPQQRHESALFLIVSAMEWAFPCKTERR